MESDCAMEFERILLPVEFSALSEPAIEAALALARGRDTTVELLHVIEMFDGLEGDPEIEHFYQRLEKRAAAALARTHKRFEAKGINATWQVIIGHRAPVIVERARDADADVIVMGTHSVQEGSPAAVLSSTSHRVTLLAPCAVMIVGRQALMRAIKAHEARA